MSGAVGPMNGQIQARPQLRLTTLEAPPAAANCSALIPFTVTVGEPTRISCREVRVAADGGAAAAEVDEEVYLGEQRQGVRLLMRVLDTWGNVVVDKARACNFVADSYASQCKMKEEWSQVRQLCLSMLQILPKPQQHLLIQRIQERLPVIGWTGLRLFHAPAGECVLCTLDRRPLCSE